MKIKHINIEPGYIDNHGRNGVLRIDYFIGTKSTFQFVLFEDADVESEFNKQFNGIKEALHDLGISDLPVPDLSLIKDLHKGCFNSGTTDEVVIKYRDNIPVINYLNAEIHPLDDALALTGNQFVKQIQDKIHTNQVKRDFAVQRMRSRQ